MTNELSARIHNATETALAFVCTYMLAFYWHLDRPFWAGFTVFVVSLPSIGQSLQKGVLRMFGTFLGAAVGLILLALFAQDRFVTLAALSVYVCLMMSLMLASASYGYVYFISCIVTLVIVLMGIHQPQNGFYLSVYRAEETLLGIGVYTAVTVIFSPRTSIRVLHGDMGRLMEGHKKLFDMNAGDEEGKMPRMYAQYVAMRDVVATTEQLVPAVRLENYQGYRYRDFWMRAIRCSAELLELQRKWTGTLVAMKDLDMAALFPGFDSRIAELGQLFGQLDAVGREDAPVGSANPEEVRPLDMDETVFEQLGSTRKGLAFSVIQLYAEQCALCRELIGLAAFLLHGAPAPVLSRSEASKDFAVIKPEQYAYMSQMFVIFWVAALCWILLNPPGLESIAFLEMTILLGMIGVMTGQDKPLAQVLTFGLGILCTGVLYVFVYPVLGNLGEFLLLMGVTGFLISFAFPRRDQNFAKQAFMLPWLSLGNFTNVPTYDFGQLLTGSYTLLFGISIVSLVHYVFFMPNTEALFLRKQRAFFLSSGKMLRHLRECGARRRSLTFRLRVLFRLHRTRFLADEIAMLSKKLPVGFVKPEIAQVFSTEVRDMVAAMSGLYARLRTMDRDVLCLSDDELPPMSGGTLKGQLESMQRAARVMQENLRALVRSEGGADRPAVQGMIVSCGGIMKAVSNTLDVMRSIPVEADSRERF